MRRFKLKKLKFLNKDRLAINLVVLFFFVLCVFVWVIGYTSPLSAAWWNSGWRFRKRIPITYSGASTLTDYQAKLVIDTASLIAVGNMQANCFDMRFANASGVEYPYWIESGCNTSSTIVWVKLDSISAPSKEVYMYYGNPSAVAGSDGSRVFPFFDGFDGTVLDSSKWSATDPTGVSVNGGEVTITRGSVYTKSKVFTEMARVEAKLKWNNFALRSGLNFSDRQSLSYSAANFANGSSNNGVYANAYATGSEVFTREDGLVGLNSYILSIALQGDGKVLIGGWFTTYNGVSRNYIARLNADGSLDSSFNVGSGANGFVQSIASQGDGKVLIGGSFTTYNGVSRNYIARLNADGSLDSSFNVGSGANSAIRSIVLQGDGKVLIGGWFTTYNENARAFITRLTAVGQLEYNIALDQMQFVASATESFILGIYTDGNSLVYEKNRLQTGSYSHSVGAFAANNYVSLGSPYVANAGDINIADITVDWVLVRAYSAVEPTMGTLGFEEVSKEPILHLSFDEGYGTTAYNRAGVQPPRDPVAHWKMDETSGTAVADSTANGNNGTAVNGPTVGTGKRGMARIFDGTDDYVSVPHSDKLNSGVFGTSTKFTISAWAYPTAWVNYSTIVNKAYGGSWSNTTNGLWSTIDGFECIMGSNVTGNPTGSYIRIFNKPALNEWHHIVCSANGTNLVMYVDGVEVGRKSISLITYTRTANTEPITIGRRYIGAGESFPGRMDDIKLYDYALTPEQIVYEYTHTNGMMINMDDSNWVQGVDGTALSFNGVDEYVNIGFSNSYPSLMNSKASSICAWMNTESVSAGRIVSFQRGDQVTALSLGIGNGGILQGYYRNNSNTFSTVSSDITVSNGMWKHVCLTTYDNTIKLYIDGNFVNSASDFDSNYSYGFSGDIATIGSLKYSNYFLGKLDELKIYPYARTPSEIKADFNAYRSKVGTGVGHGDKAPSQSSSEKPILWYDFNDGTGTSIFDRSGNGRHGIMKNMDDKTDYVQGKFGQALDFDGVDDFVDSKDLDINGSFTLQAWVKPSGTAKGTVVCKGTGADINYCLDLRNNDNSVGFFVYDNGGVARGLTGATTTKVQTGKWTHIAGVYDASATPNFRVFVNGVQISDTANWTGTMKNNDINVSVGARAGSFFLKAQIDEVKIYNYARTVAQIQEDMKGGPIAYWSFDEGYGTTARDKVGGNHGTLTGGPLWVDGKFGRALRFNNGTKFDRVMSSDEIRTGDELTWSVWINPDSYTGQGDDTLWQNVLAQYEWDNNDWGIFLAFTHYYNYLLHIKTTAGYQELLYPQNNIPLNQWSHLAFTYSKASGLTKLYLNGREVASSSNGGASILYSPDGFFRRVCVANRCDHNGYAAYSGGIDDVRIYNYALTPEEILAEYNAPSGARSFAGTSVRYGVGGPSEQGFTMPNPVAYWNFDEGSGTTANDLSGNGRTATLTNSPVWVQGKYSKGVSFNGTTQSANATVTDPGFTNTIAGWFYPTTSVASKTLVTSGKLVTDGSSRPTYGSCVGKPMSLNKWTHIVAISNGAGSCAIYQDGLQTATNTTGVSLGTAINIANSSFSGKVDEVKVFSEALSPIQVAWEYNKGKPIFHMKMDQREFYDCDGAGSGTGTVCESVSGLHGLKDGSMTNSNWVDGKFGRALRFNNGTKFDRVMSSDEIRTGDELTWSVWINPDSYTGQGDDTLWQNVLAQYEWDNNDWGIFLAFTHYYNYLLHIKTTAGYQELLYPQNNIPLNQWSHLAFTYSKASGLTKLYLNGREVASSSNGGASILYSPDGFFRRVCVANRCDHNGYAAYSGGIDDVRIYNYARTPEQIKRDYLDGASVRFGE